MVEEDGPGPLTNDGLTNGPVGFIGLGHMGGPMAANLVAAGHDVIVLDARPERMDEAAQLGAKKAASLSDLAPASVVLLSLPGPREMEEVVLAPGLISQLQPGSAIISVSTISLDSARLMAAAAKEASLHFIDAPVTGAADGARAASLTIMVGAERDAIARARPLLETIGSSIHFLGPPGAGTVGKLLTNMLWFVHVVGLCEALAVGARAGIDPEAFANLVKDSAAASWVADHDLENILESNDDESFTLALCCKDLRQIESLLDQSHYASPLAQAATDRFNDALGKFGADAGELAVSRVIEAEVGVSIRKPLAQVGGHTG
jgi:3-hydroxyisobutyrate dehydrogenase